MSEKYDVIINDKWILANRGKKMLSILKNHILVGRKEHTISGKIEDTAIIFLTNRECPFHCLMCDLWKNTTEKPVPPGSIPDQIEWALAQMPEAKHLKLYNNGNFFDERAIPEKDYKRIADLVSNFETVIVESHPKLINKKCLHFKDLLKPELQVAVGLETVHPEVLRKLNKQMTLEDFRNSINYLTQNKIRSRAFILLRPPFLTESEGVFWAQQSIDFAFKIGVECCAIIPVRAGNGAMDLLMEKGDFSLPDIHSLEMVLEYGIRLNAGRVFADVWDLHLFSNCEKCIKNRINRLTTTNLNQRIVQQVICSCNPSISEG